MIGLMAEGSEPINLDGTLDKGKGKVKAPSMHVGEASVDGPATCGICLTDAGGRSARGIIDSCNHYFCFVCIMEWARVESRCPACRIRFCSIRRPSVAGIFNSERLVHVHVRDQVYHPLGNESVAAADPYKDTNCSSCDSATDDELLLLCDLCDSAAHTYCVGLGATVPEGDWFCADCSISRDVHCNLQLDADHSEQVFQDKPAEVLVSDPTVSIFDIVSDETTSRVRVPSDNKEPSRRTVPQNSARDDILHSEELPGCDGFTPRPLSHGIIPKQGARTLQHRRDIHYRIRKLRENWNDLRAGSVDFSFSISNNTHTEGVREHTRINSKLQRSVPSVSSAVVLETPAEATVSTKTASCKNINKAWKMMKIAKSMQGNKDTMRNHTSTSHGEAYVAKASMYACSSSTASRSQIPRVCVGDSVSSSKRFLDGTHVGPKEKKSKFHSPVKQTAFSFVPDCLDGLKTVLTQRVPKKGLAVYDNKQDPPSNSVSASFSHSGDSHLSQKKVEGIKPSNLIIRCGDAIINEVNVVRRNDTMNDAKAEIQSLVKLNLKLLNRDKHIGTDRFKDVARVSTHTILAACGLEHSKSTARSFPSLICKHVENKTKKSNLMPNSCRACFYSFVKDVVDSVACD